MKKIKSLLILIILLIVIISCGSNKGEVSSSESSDELTIGVTSFADTLEPTEQYFSWVITRYGVGENLTRFDEEGEIQPLLAESWEADGNKWIFKIREGVKFSNGNPLTAEAVKNSLERVFEKTKRGESFFTYTSITADGNNLIIETENPVSTLPLLLADPLFLIIDTTAKTDDEIAKTGPIATGPYKVVSFEPGIQTVLEKNENYWRGMPHFNKVIVKDINDQNTRALALKSGEIQVAYNLKKSNEADFEGINEIKEKQLQSLRTTFAFLNQNGPLGDKALRQAVIRALDRETYTQVLLGGAATAGKTIIPPTLDYGFEEANDENAFNVDSAKEILKSAGYVDVNGDGFVEMPDGSPLDLEFVIYTSREELGIYAQAAQSSLSEIGIKVTLKPVSYETVLDLRETGNYDLLIWNVLVANTGDPENFLRENWFSKSTYNTAGYNNPNVDRLLEELKLTVDNEERNRISREIQQSLLDDAAVLVFGYETTYLFYNEKVKNIKLYPMDYYWVTYDVSY